MVVSHKLFVTFNLLLLAFAVTPNALNAMKTYGTAGQNSIQLTTVGQDDGDNNDDQDFDREMSCCTKILQCLHIDDTPIKTTKVDRLFAERFVNLFDDIKKFNNLTRRQRTELMDKFLDIAYAIRNGRADESLDRINVVLSLLEESFNDLISRQSDNQEEKRFLEKLSLCYKNMYRDDTLARGMGGMCHYKYHQMSDSQEKAYCTKLFDLLGSRTMGNVAMKLLLLEALNRCDDNFNQLDHQFKNSLSIRDLIEKWCEVCGHQPTSLGRLMMATSGAEDAYFCDFVCSCCCLMRISGAASMIVFFFRNPCADHGFAVKIITFNI